MKKILPIGYEDFKEIIDKQLYYVDKTLLIKDLIDSEEKVLLFTRPRRFGKTLNLSMIRRFFECEKNRQGNLIDHRYLFSGLNIEVCGETYLSQMQQYPVINLSLKSAKQPDFQMSYASILDEISKEYKRHDYVLEHNQLSPMERERFQKIMNLRAEKIEYAKSLEFLSECLCAYHEKNAIILIDEYDVPLENAYLEGFYEPMSAFIRSLFESALKTNPCLEQGIVTGCLRISRESIFTGLNNMKVYSVLSNSYGQYFGFLQEEVNDLLSFFDVKDKESEVREWYDGYCFGTKELYNPWSILYYVDELYKGDTKYPKPYWSNTSSNDIIKELVENADKEMRYDLEILMNGGSICKQIHEEITYADIHESSDNLWNFLFFTGYLKKRGEHTEGKYIYLDMSIPNLELEYIYEETIKDWFDRQAKKTDMNPLLRAMEEGDCSGIEDFVNRQLQDTISYFDYNENYYHGFLAGLLKANERYRVLSNRESGVGRADLLLMENRFGGKGIVLELKVATEVDQMEKLCTAALEQIHTRNYEELLRKEGCQEILKYGICFFKKGCMAIIC